MNRFGERIRRSLFDRQSHLPQSQSQSVPTATKKLIREGISNDSLSREQASRKYDLPLSVIDELLQR